MRDKKYGSYTDEYLNDWQALPAVAPILTSSQFGAWLMRRDNRRDIRQYEIIKAEVDDLKCYVGETDFRDRVFDLLDKHIKEIDNERS